MYIENLRRNAKNKLKDINFKKMEPEAGNYQLWHIEA
jgi:hypothetical protein